MDLMLMMWVVWVLWFRGSYLVCFLFLVLPVVAGGVWDKWLIISGFMGLLLVVAVAGLLLVVAVAGLLPVVHYGIVVRCATLLGGVCGSVSSYYSAAAKSAPIFGNKGGGGDEDIHNLGCGFIASEEWGLREEYSAS